MESRVRGQTVYSVDPATGLKRCRTCKEAKALDQYNRASAAVRAHEGIQPHCRSCESQRNVASGWHSLTREQQLAQNVRRYGLTYEQYVEMLTAQGGVCAICSRPERRTLRGKVCALAVDHDHQSGRVRGLLCHDCNTGLGKFLDNSATLRAAATYLERN